MVLALEHRFGSAFPEDSLEASSWKWKRAKKLHWRKNLCAQWSRAKLKLPEWCHYPNLFVYGEEKKNSMMQSIYDNIVEGNEVTFHTGCF